MRDSSHAGERAAAEVAVERLVRPFGFNLSHVERLLVTNGKVWQETAFEAEQRHRREHEAREKEAVLLKYGGLEGVCNWQPKETLLREAVYGRCTFGSNERSHWIESIDGWSIHSLDPLPQSARRCIETAFLLPKDVTTAHKEALYWQRRDRELGLVFDNTSDTQLDLPSYARLLIVEDLLISELRAISVQEILIRKFYVSTQFADDRLEKAILLDLMHLAATSPPKYVHSGHGPEKAKSTPSTASERRRAVEELLSNMDAASLSDREIARRTSVSPQTVGNIRRRLALQNVNLK